MDYSFAIKSALKTVLKWTAYAIGGLVLVALLGVYSVLRNDGKPVVLAQVQPLKVTPAPKPVKAELVEAATIKTEPVTVAPKVDQTIEVDEYATFKTGAFRLFVLRKCEAMVFAKYPNLGVISFDWLHTNKNLLGGFRLEKGFNIKSANGQVHEGTMRCGFRFSTGDIYDFQTWGI